MALKDILAISGKGGLFKFISQSRNGIIVEGLHDKKRTHASASAKISALEDIAIFTLTTEVPLNDVFKSIFEKENEGKAPVSKASSADELKSYMEEILPDYDRDRVYVSDLKKIFTWYNLLHDYGLLSFDEEKEDEEAAQGEDTPAGNESDDQSSKDTPKPEDAKETGDKAN